MKEKESNIKIYFECQKCKAKYWVSIDHAGKLGTCKKCGAKVTIPLPQLDYSKHDAAQSTHGTSKISNLDNFIQKKPKPWGSTIALIFGILGLIIIIALGVYLYSKILNGNKNYNQKTPVQNVKNTIPIISKGNLCQITIPKYWKVLENINKNAAIQVGNLQKEEYLIILPDYKRDFSGSIEDHSKITSDNILNSLENGSKRHIKTLTINGYKAIIYRISGMDNRKKIIYLHITLEGDKAFYQVIACSRHSRAKESNERFLSVLKTFREL